MAKRTHHEEGFALVIALMALLLMSGLGLALVATTASETTIAANFRSSGEAFYAAEAAGERAIDDLRTALDWTLVLNGAIRSTFIDGAPDGTRALADGSTVDLNKTMNLANCNKTTTCRPADMDAVTAERPWGANNPRWQLYAYGHLSHMLPSRAIPSPYYVIAMVADDPSENDSNPMQDGIEGVNPGAGVLSLRAEAFGPLGAHKVIEMTLAHPPPVRVLSWRELR